MLPLHFKHFFPWFVAKSEMCCRADAQRSQDKNADALYQLYDMQSMTRH